MFIDAYPDDEYWSQWKPMVRDVVCVLEARGLAPLFRIGMGMHHIIFSTSERHGLTSEPRLTLEFHPKEQIVRIAYGCTNLSFNDPLSEEHVPPSMAVRCILRYLRRMWTETKPDTQSPDALDTA